MESCETCRFAGKYADAIYEIVPTKGKWWQRDKYERVHTRTEEGFECFRFPPSHDAWPLVEPDNWCGEYQKAKP